MSGKGVPPSALIAAIRGGNLNAVIDALDNGADIEEADIHGQRGLPLRTACFGGKPDIVDTLIRRGANINAPGSDGPGMPLRLAVRTGQRDVTILLLKRGAIVPAGLQISPELLAAADAQKEVSPPKAELAPLPYERVTPSSLLAGTEAGADEEHFDIIENIDISSSYGTDTNVLTMDMLRLDENRQAEAARAAAEQEKSAPTGKKPGFWRPGRRGS